jgi:ABC-type enterochelin transport system ATPase subunit
VLAFLRRSVREFGQTIVMVTHDPNAASYADRVVFLADGRIVDELADPTAEAVLERMKSLDAGAPQLQSTQPQSTQLQAAQLQAAQLQQPRPSHSGNGTGTA